MDRTALMAGKFISQYVKFERFVYGSLAGSNIECNQHLDCIHMVFWQWYLSA